MELKHYGLALLVVLIFGFNFPFMKIGVEEIPPLIMVFLRFLLVALLLLPFVKAPPKEAWLPLLGLAATLGVIHFSMMFTGLKHIDASLAAIMVQIQVPASAVLAAIFFNDKLGWRRTIGMGFAIVGVLILVGEPQGNSSLWGVAMVITAVLAWSVSNIQAKKLEGLGVGTLNAYMALLTLPLLFPIIPFVEGTDLSWVEEVTWVGVTVAIYQAVAVVIIAYGIWYSLLRRFDVNQVVPITLLVPVLGVIFSMLILGEELTLIRLIGGIITIFGVAIMITRRPTLFTPNTQ